LELAALPPITGLIQAGSRDSILKFLPVKFIRRTLPPYPYLSKASSPFFSHLQAALLQEERPFHLGIFAFNFLFKLCQRRGFFIRFIGDGSLSTGLNTIGFSPAKITHIDQVRENLHRPNGAVFNTGAA
jgi:hypothetical protein